MKFFIAACLLVAVQAYDCSEGQKVWCSSINAAKACGAVNHCKDTVWKNVQLSEDPSDVCTFCKTIMTDVQQMLENQKEQAEIQKFLQSACSVIPDETIQKECSSIVQNDLPVLLMLISEELDPTLVCGLMKLCKNAEIFMQTLVEEPEESPVQQMQVAVGGDICTDCKKFFGDIVDEITSETTEQELEEMIDNLFCANLGGLEETCKEIVADYIPEILQMIADETDPAVECQALGFCSMTQVARVIIPKLRLQKTKLYHLVNGNEYCDFCKDAINEIISLDKDPEVEKEIESMIDQFLCSNLGDYADLCREEVKQYLPEILELIAGDLDADADCKAIGLCTDKKSSSPLYEMLQSKVTDDDLKALRESGPKMTKVSASSQCVLCEFIMKELDGIITENATEAEIIKALDMVCSILPSTIATECEDFVNTYGPAVLVLISDEVDPKTICVALGLCSASGIKDVKDEEVCLVCKTAVQYVDSLLGENATQAEIKAELEKICNFVPDSFKTECDDLIEQYEPMLIQLLLKDLSPEEVCTEIGVCPGVENTIVPEKQPLLGQHECTWGPGYWCASKENAAKCKAVDHCMKHVWN